MGAGTFYFKTCDPAGPDAARYCEHVFDRIGCKYNAPAAYQDGVFLSCLRENQDFPNQLNFLDTSMPDTFQLEMNQLLVCNLPSSPDYAQWMTLIQRLSVL